MDCLVVLTCAILPVENDAPFGLLMQTIQRLKYGSSSELLPEAGNSSELLKSHIVAMSEIKALLHVNDNEGAIAQVRRSEKLRLVDLYINAISSLQACVSCTLVMQFFEP